MSRSARLLDLIQALRRRRRPVAGAVLAEELGVSLRTLYRDVGTLIGQGVPITGEAGIGYVLQPGFLLPPMRFGDDELDAVILGLRLVSARGDVALAAGAVDALAKIVAVLPSEMAEAAHESGLLAGPKQARGPAAIAAVRTAMRRERKLRLHYGDKAGVATERVVWPVAMGFFETAEVLAAWCELRGDFRHFRLDRIAETVLLEERPPTRRRVLLAEWRARHGPDEA